MTTTAQPAKVGAKENGRPRGFDQRRFTVNVRALLDDGSVELITRDDDAGMLAATGTIGGSPVVVFCSDATVMGGAMGVRSCEVVVKA